MLSPQITALLASLGAGNPGAPMGETGQPLPAPPPPVVPGRPSAGSAAGRSPLDLIAPFLAIGTALSGNTQAATGSFEGLAQNELQRQQREQADQILQQRNQQFGLQAHAQQLQEQRLQQQDAAQQQAAEQQRQRALMAEVEHVRKLMPTFKTQQDYDTYINFAEDNLGVRRNTVRAIVPFRNEHAEKAMHEAVVAAVKQGGLDILDRPDLVIQVADVNGDGSGKSAVTLGEAMRIGNYVAVRDPSTGKLVKAPEIAKSDTRDAVEKMLDANLSQFAAQKGWKPTEKDPEWKAIYQQSLKEVSQARDLPNAAPSMAVKPLSRFQRNTLERQLRAEAEKHIAPIREMNRQVVVMRAGMAEIKRTGKLSAGTQAVINTFNRSMEPGSVTREAEYLRSTLGQSLFDSFAGRWNALTQGGPGVLEKNLADIVALSERIASETADLSKTNIDMIRGHAEEEGLPVDRVVPPEASYRLTGPTTSGSGPATGSIVTLKDGRRVRVETVNPDGTFSYTVVR